MKIGDLVKCLWQPRTSKVQHGVCIPMSYRIEGELGIYIKHRGYCSGVVLFPRFGYEHTLSHSALQLVASKS